MTMTVAQYANKVGIAVDGILSLCNMLGIQVDSADDVLSEEDVLLLDNAIKEMLEDNDSSFGGSGGAGTGGGTGGGSETGGGETTSNASSTVEPLKEDNLAVSNAIEYDPSYVKNAMQCLKNMQTMEENPNYGMIGEQISSNRYNIGAYTSEVDSKSYTEMAASLLYYTVQNLDEGFDFGLYDDDYSLEEYYEKMLTGEFNDENGVFDEELAQEYLKNVDLGTEEENWYYTGEFYSKLLNGDFHDKNGVYSEELAQEYFNGVSAIIENNNRIRAEENEKIYYEVVGSVASNYEQRSNLYNKWALEKENEIKMLDNQIAILESENDNANGMGMFPMSDKLFTIHDMNTVLENEEKLKELRQRREDLILQAVGWKNASSQAFLDSLGMQALSKDFANVSSLEGFVIDPKYTEYYSYLSSEEQHVVAYLQKTENTDWLERFFVLKRDEINRIRGQEQAQKVLDEVDQIMQKDIIEFSTDTMGLIQITPQQQAVAHLATLGFLDGFQNFCEGFKNLGSADGIVSPDQYATGFVIQGLQEKYGADGLFGGNYLTGTYEISSSIGNMAIPMGVGALATLVSRTPQVGVALAQFLSGAGAVTMGLSATGNSREQGLQQGMTNEQAWTYGIMSGASEMVMEKVLGGIPFVGKLDEIPGIKGFLFQVLGEGVEEGVQSVLDPMFASVATGTYFDSNSIDWGEVAKSGVYGMMTAGLLNGAKIFQTVSPDSIVNNNMGDMGYYLDKKTSDDLAAKYKGKDFNDPNVVFEFKTDLETALGLDSNTIVFRVGNVEYAISRGLANQLLGKYGNKNTQKRTVMNEFIYDLQHTSGVLYRKVDGVKNKKGVYYVGDGGETLISSSEGLYYVDDDGNIIRDYTEEDVEPSNSDGNNNDFGTFGKDTDIYTELELLGNMQARLNDMGIDTSGMSFDDMKTKYPDIYDEVLNSRVFEQNESQQSNQSSEVEIIDDVDLFSKICDKLEEMGIDTSDMSFEEMKNKYSDIYDEVLNPRVFEQNESQQSNQSSEVEIIDDVDLFSDKLEEMGIDTSDMSFEEMKAKYPVIYDEVLNPVKFEQSNSQDISEQSEEDNSNVVIDNFFDYLCGLKPTDSPEILELYSSIAEHVKEYNEKGLYTLFNSKHFSDAMSRFVQLEFLPWMLEKFIVLDGKSQMPRELGEFLESLLEKDDLIIGMHNTEISDHKMKTIFKYGLSNNGNSYGDVPSLTFTVDFLKDIRALLDKINSKYKGSKGGFLFAFPKNLVDAEGKIISEAVIDEIYIKKGEGYYINPKYILGYVGYGDDKVVKYYPRDEFLSKESSLVLDEVSDTVELNDKLTATRDNLKLFDISINDFISNFGNVIPMDVKKFFLDIKKVFDDAFNYVNDTVELGNESVVVDDVEYADDFYVSSMEINNKIQNYLKQVNEILNNYKNQLVEFSMSISLDLKQVFSNLMLKLNGIVELLKERKSTGVKASIIDVGNDTIMLEKGKIIEFFEDLSEKTIPVLEEGPTIDSVPFENAVNSDQYTSGMDIKKEIYDKMPANLDIMQKIRYLYLELNKRVTYDFGFFSLENGPLRDKYITQEISFESMKNNRVLCIGWSKLYRDLLIDAGIPSEMVSIKGGKKSHQWVEIDFGDYIIRADATDAFNHSVDLSASKSGSATNGFIKIGKEFAGINISGNNANGQKIYDTLDKDDMWLRQIDSQLGYTNNGMYFNEVVSKLKEHFYSPDAVWNIFGGDEDAAFLSKWDYFSRLTIPKNMNAYDAYVYFLQAKYAVFGKDERIEVTMYNNYSNNGDVNVGTLCVLKMNEDGSYNGKIMDDVYGIYYVRFKDYFEYEDYVKKQGWTPFK